MSINLWRRPGVSLSATLLGMTLCEGLKAWLFPDLSAWQGHAITVMSSGVLAGLASLWVSRDLNDMLEAQKALRASESRNYLISQAASQQKNLLSDALQRADHDSLTDLLNHRAFHNRLNEEADRALREGTLLLIAMLDLDNFKFFNDHYTHVVGDGVLCTVARKLKGLCRSYDVVARYGGDEFALLLPVGPETEPAEIESRLREALQGMTFSPEGSEEVLPLSVSVGVAVFPRDRAARLEALELASARLLQSKVGGDEPGGLSERLRAELSRQIAGFPLVDGLVNVVDNKDRYTRRHSEDVLTYSLQIAAALGLDGRTQHIVAMSALIHDVGKIGVPDSVLRKPGPLTVEESDVVKQHPMMGAIIVQAVPGLEETLDAIRYHHERWDGNGYPHGLAGEETPLIARIMAVADAFSAMTTDRPYRKGLDHEKALAILQAGAETQWDPRCVDAFVQTFSRDPERILS